MKEFASMRTNLLIDNIKPTEATEIPACAAFTGRKGYRKVSPRRAKLKANEAYAGALRSLNFSLFIYPQHEPPIFILPAITLLSKSGSQHVPLPASALQTPVSGR